jgi:D-cysteine desulfhydrase
VSEADDHAGAEGDGDAAGEPALFQRFSALRGRIARVPLAGKPTPTQLLDLPGHPHLWVKRDDLSAPVYGGNKVRKLEFLIGDAVARGARRLITVGAAGSHHALATALYGREHDLPVSLVLFPQPLTRHVRDVLLTDLSLGAELRWSPRMEAVPAAALLARIAHRRDAPYMIPGGGSSPIGALGYVSAALELEDQVRRGEIPEPETIHVAAGTLGTAAGLAVGLSLGGLATRVHAIRIASPLVTNRRTLRRLIAGVTEILAMHGVSIPDVRKIESRVELTHDAIGFGYGHSTAAGAAAMDVLAQSGLVFDETYTAKAAAAMLARLRGAGGVQLYWHTLSAVEPLRGGANVQDLPSSFRRYLRDYMELSNQETM